MASISIDYPTSGTTIPATITAYGVYEDCTGTFSATMTTGSTSTPAFPSTFQGGTWTAQFNGLAAGTYTLKVQVLGGGGVECEATANNLTVEAAAAQA